MPSFERDSAPRVVSRNATPRSRLCHDLIGRFLASGMHAARVSPILCEELGVGSLYRGLWNACQNGAVHGRVRVHRQNGAVLLLRVDEA